MNLAEGENVMKCWQEHKRRAVPEKGLNHLLLLLSHFSRVQLFATPWTVPRQAPLSVRFTRQEYCSGVPLPPPGIFPSQGSNPCPLVLLH